MKLPARAKATEKTLRKYEGRAVNWEAGATCIHMVRSHLKHMGRKVPVVPAFKTPLGAKKALANLGYNNLEELLDAHLERIAPAMMLIGDIALLEADGDEQTLFGGTAIISAGVGGKAFGWHPDAPAFANLVPLQIKAAWRA